MNIFETAKQLAEKFITFISQPGFLITVIIFTVIALILAILQIISMWKIFKRAGLPGWLCLVPYVSDYGIVKVAGFDGTLSALAFGCTLIPTIDFFTFSFLTYKIARSYGKGWGFGIGLMLLPFIFYPMLSFGNEAYQREPIKLGKKFLGMEF